MVIYVQAYISIMQNINRFIFQIIGGCFFWNMADNLTHPIWRDVHSNYEARMTLSGYLEPYVGRPIAVKSLLAIYLPHWLTLFLHDLWYQVCDRCLSTYLKYHTELFKNV